MKIKIECSDCGNVLVISPIDGQEMPEITACPCCGHDVTDEQDEIDDDFE